MPQATATEQVPSALLRTSHSALSDFLACPEKFRQGRILKRPETPAWWNAGGRAFHRVIELWDADRWRGCDLQDWSWEGEFLSALTGEVEDMEARTGVSRESWRASNKGTEGFDFWAANGPKYAENWEVWRKANPQWEIWATPEGEPAIELALDVQFGGVALKAFIDRVMVKDDGSELLIVDPKSGRSIPERLDQLLIYAGCIYKRYGVLPRLGGFFDARKGKLTYLERLDPEAIEDFEETFAVFIGQAEAGEYLARPGRDCATFCSFSKTCPATKRLTHFWREKAGL